MKVKLDENVDLRVVSRLQMAGHDVATAPGQGLSSAPDVEVIEVCRSEERCLVTADRGFSNRSRFDPSIYFGIVIIRLPKNPTFANWCEAIDTLILGLEQADVIGKLWIVQNSSIQEFQPLDSEETGNE
jgi:predicted nuclease of predicted toxin-antitoxin system